jgi:hypothetical protein
MLAVAKIPLLTGAMDRPAIVEVPLTAEQAELFRPVLEIQRKQEKAGIFAITGLTFDRETGNPSIRLYCNLAPWKLVQKICRLLKAEADKAG